MKRYVKCSSSEDYDRIIRLTSPARVAGKSDGLSRDGHNTVGQCEGVNRKMKKYVKSNDFDGKDSVHELLSSVPLNEEEMLNDIAVNVLQEMDQTGLSYGACKKDAITYFTDLVENQLDLFLYNEYDIDFDDSDTLQ